MEDRPDAPPQMRDVLLTAALDELRARNEQLQATHAARESELEAAVAERTEELGVLHEAAAHEYERLRALVERLEDGIVAVSRKLEIEFANAAAIRLLAPATVAAGAEMPDPWASLPLREVAARLFEPDAEVFEGRVVSTPEQTLRVTGLPARSGASAVLVLSDVTARERRERAEREFVVNAAHELRTPLAAISGAVEVLQDARDDPEQVDRFLGHIERQTARLGRLTEALLVLARADMRVESPRRELVPVLPLLDQLAAELHPAGGVRVAVECPPDVAVLAHSQVLEQALANLAANAVKHTRRGSITLRARAEDARWVALEVVDTGAGMSPDDRAHATERFFHAGAEPGFGLGLTIAAQAAEVLGGRFELESAEGVGTTARILLPRAEVVGRA